MRRKPVVGVIGNSHRLEGRFDVQAVGERNLRAIAEVAGALPLVFAGCPEITDVAALLDVVDGIVLTGARANVHVKVIYGRSSHHHVEAVFKAFARALRVACSTDRRLARMLPSTKGLL